MRLEALTVKGILRFADEVVIDFRALPTGLVALVGPNGAGKSTLLEAPLAALYRRFASRDGEIVDYAHDRDSFVEAVFSFDDGARYHARLNVDGVRRLSEAVLSRETVDGAMDPVNDGKVSTYDIAVAEAFPRLDVLLASAFASQNRAGSFVTLDRKGRKQLFATLLGLDHYEAMADIARKAASLAETSRNKLVVLRDFLQGQTGPEQGQALADEMTRITACGVAAVGRQTELRAAIADAEAQLATVADQAAAYALANQRVQVVEREHLGALATVDRLSTSRSALDGALTLERRRIEVTRNRAIVDLDARQAKSGRTLEDERAAIDAKLTAALQELDGRLKNNRDLVAMADTIRAAVKRAADLAVILADEARVQQNLRDAITAIDTRDRDVLVPNLAKGQRAQQDCQRAEADCALLGKVPCGGAGEFAACQFLVNAKAAEAKIPDLKTAAAAVPTAEAERRRVAAERADLRGKLDISIAAQAKLALERNDLLETVKLEPKLAAAEARIHELQQQRIETTATAEADIKAAEMRAADRAEDIGADRIGAQDRYEEELGNVNDRAASARAKLDAEVAAAEAALVVAAGQYVAAKDALAATAAGNQQAATLQATLTGLRARWDETTRALADVDAAERALAQHRADLTARRADLADVSTRLTAIDTELLEWQTLAKALGRDGLPVLEIDAAGPTVTAFANDLLTSCYGPRFSVELVTQEAKASGKGVKESFEVKVLDNERGGDARDLGDLSGGEQIVVDEALKNAISLYINTRNGNPIRTCWRDETTGPLDPENASRYVPMLRRVLEVGGFERIYFISHNADAAAMADAQLRFEDGRVTVALPPYAD
ncbi:SMC family ATPase [bacterium]|nr:SMC family ATPase [bacterium]